MKFPAYVASFPTATMSSAIANFPHLQLNLAQQQATGSELEAMIQPAQVALEKTTSFSAFIPELCLDSACFSVISSTLCGCTIFLQLCFYIMTFGSNIYHNCIAASSTLL